MTKRMASNLGKEEGEAEGLMRPCSVSVSGGGADEEEDPKTTIRPGPSSPPHGGRIAGGSGAVSRGLRDLHSPSPGFHPPSQEGYLGRGSLPTYLPGIVGKNPVELGPTSPQVRSHEGLCRVVH